MEIKYISTTGNTRLVDDVASIVDVNHRVARQQPTTSASITSTSDLDGITIRIPWTKTERPYQTGSILSDQVVSEIRCQVFHYRQPILLMECDKYVIIGPNQHRVLYTKLDTLEKISLECCNLSKKPWWTREVHHRFHEWAVDRLSKQ